MPNSAIHAAERGSSVLPERSANGGEREKQLRKHEGGNAPEAAGRRLAGRLGVAAFVFFLIKGLLWLIIPGVAAAWAML